MPCPCNFNKNKLKQNLYVKEIIEPSQKIRTKSDALFTKKKLLSLKQQVNLKHKEGLEFKLLPRTIHFNVVNVDGKNKIHLDNRINYNQNKVYHVTPGIYKLVGVPELHAIRLSKEHSNLDMHSKQIITCQDGKEYYYGNVIMVVRGDFGNNGLYCCNHGFMGREDLLYYKFS